MDSEWPHRTRDVGAQRAIQGLEHRGHLSLNLRGIVRHRVTNQRVLLGLLDQLHAAVADCPSAAADRADRRGEGLGRQFPGRTSRAAEIAGTPPVRRRRDRHSLVIDRISDRLRMDELDAGAGSDAVESVVADTADTRRQGHQGNSQFGGVRRVCGVRRDYPLPTTTTHTTTPVVCRQEYTSITSGGCPERVRLPGDKWRNLRVGRARKVLKSCRSEPASPPIPTHRRNKEHRYV